LENAIHRDHFARPQRWTELAQTRVQPEPSYPLRMKDVTQGVCALCRHNEVIQAWPIEHGNGSSTGNVAATEGLVGGAFAKTQQFGLMAAYTCQKCGFVMWFANDPQHIPIGDEYRTRLIEGSGAE
jgi:hypothetical protein